jgi:hypothetical protein
MFLESFFESDPEGLNTKFEWKNRKRSLYLKFTDGILWFFYQVFWNKAIYRSSGK